MPAPLKVPCKLPISPVQRISPAIYTSFKACRLMGVLSANKVPILLPKHPKAYLGTIIRDLIARGMTGQISDFDHFCKLWDEQIASIENKLLESDLTRHLVPLSRNISDMAQSKFLCWEIIRSNINKTQTDRIDVPSHDMRPHKRSESWVQTKDGVVGGLIDLIVQEPSGTVIVEFKTGNIFSNDSEQNGNNDEIRLDYLTQIRLYAGLFRESKGYWPSNIRIATIDGKKYNVRYDETDCVSLLDKAKKDLSSTNCIIRTLYRDYDALLDRLAFPNINTCKYCNYRPGCSRYWREKSLNRDEQLDCRGIIREVFKLGDGTQFAKLEDVDLGRTIMIRKIYHSRYDISKAIGREIIVCNLLSDHGAYNFKAGMLTTICLI